MGYKNSGLLLFIFELMSTKIKLNKTFYHNKDQCLTDPREKPICWQLKEGAF